MDSTSPLGKIMMKNEEMVLISCQHLTFCGHSEDLLQVISPIDSIGT